MLRNSNTNTFAVKYRLFSIVCKKHEDNRKYHYYIRYLLSSNLGSKKIYSSSSKVKYLNKITLSTIGVIANILYYILLFPVRFILSPFAMYIIGAKWFIKNNAWVENVRYFNWVNFIAVLILLVLYILK